MNETRNETTDGSLGAEVVSTSPGDHLPAEPSPPVACELDPSTDEGLRTTLRRLGHADVWDTPTGHELLIEIRRRAARTAAHIAAKTGVNNDRTLVDDVVASAWLVAVTHCEKIIKAERPWAYLMQSAQRHTLDEVRAQQLLTSPTRVRGASRATLPSVMHRVGSTAHDLAVAFQHESSGPSSDTRAIRTLGRRSPDGLTTMPHGTSEGTRHGWFVRLVALLVEHGANQALTEAALDRLADVMTSNRPSYWEWAAGNDPVLFQALGVSPDQASALVALRSDRSTSDGRTNPPTPSNRLCPQRHAVRVAAPPTDRHLTSAARAPSLGCQRNPPLTLHDSSRRPTSTGRSVA